MESERFSGRTARWIVGALLVWAAVMKLADPLPFLAEARAYPFVPRVLLPGVLVFPPLEALLGAGLCLGVWTRACWLGTVLLMVLFTALLGYAWAADLYRTCSCFGDALRMPLPLAVARNLVLLAVAVFQYRSHRMG